MEDAGRVTAAPPTGRRPLPVSARRARNKLLVACVLCVVFIVGELLGGILAGSLAIMTDAAHLLSDLAGFLISLFALYMAQRPPSSTLSFGWQRIEILAAVLSVLLIWALTGVLVYEAVVRAIDPPPVDGQIMFITAIGGVAVNILMGITLHQGHSHASAHAHAHGAAASTGASVGVRAPSLQEPGDENALLAATEPTDGPDACAVPVSEATAMGAVAAQRNVNINVRSAFIHVLGDLVQSVGVCIASIIIWVHPSWSLADPICTFLFSVLVLFTTLQILKESVYVLMEGVPKGISVPDVCRALEAIVGVAGVHQLHIWSLTMGKAAIAVHLSVTEGADHCAVLTAAQNIVCRQFGIHDSTIQIEYHETTHDLSHCLGGQRCYDQGAPLQ